MTQEERIHHAKQLIAIESTADKPQNLKRAVDYIASLIADVPGVRIERFERAGKPSLLAYCAPQRPEQFSVMLNGHVDVVPAQASQFKPVVKDDALYGRGAVDMKVAALILAEVFSQIAPTAPFAIGLQIVSDEEIGGINGTNYQIEQGVKADFVIAGEFSKRAHICTHSRGICMARVHIRGESAHSAYLWNGKNALLQAQQYTDALLRKYPVPQHDEWRTTANVASISTPNVTFNRVPDEATIMLDIRHIETDQHFTSKDAAAHFLQTIDPNATVEIVNFEPCHVTSDDDPFVQQLAQAITQTLHIPAVCYRKHGASDIRFYSEQGTPSVMFGLQGEGLHGDGEYVLLSSLPEYHDTLITFLKNLQPKERLDTPSKQA